MSIFISLLAFILAAYGISVSHFLFTRFILTEESTWADISLFLSFRFVALVVATLSLLFFLGAVVLFLFRPI